MKFRSVFTVYFFTALAFFACTEKPSKIIDSYIYLQNDGRSKDQWKLVWSDEFNGPSLDTTKWTKIPKCEAAWCKHLSDDPRCFEFSDGKLHLLGINNPDTLSDPRPYLTGGIWSKGKFAYQYGKVEIRAKLESAQGAWPAIWMLAEQNKYGEYPKNGEIDIMEHLNFDSLIYQTTHSHYTLNLKQTKKPPHGGTAAFDPGVFNTFGLEWYPDKLVFTLNGKPSFSYPALKGVDSSQWPYDQPFYLLIDQQLKGSWVGDVNPEHLPVRMIIDWVRVYQ
ncbi:beta-glucanase [Fulvitalea axinellae]|uniref:Beta-glucanase n=1 Tax=Fulvitalea axinellae TaxID=1182444 RepID=A0AAU9CRU9_9BACT|nr:beta-glucanase [Fulvitalea axinellae]